MPVRDAEHEVDATLEALFAQTRLPDEIIIADGGSRDGTRERIARWAGGAVPLRILPNPTRFAGGGRNVATAASRCEVIANLDFGNLAEPDWLEEMVRPFDEDPSVEFVTGVHVPTLDSPFQRVCAAVVYTDNLMLPTMTLEDVTRKVGARFIPGGIVAYRRTLWERAGGYCEWAHKGQDRLFGRRVREIQGRIAISLRAVVRHHMASSLVSLMDRHFHYQLWAARMGLESPGMIRLASLYLFVLLVGLAMTALPATWVVLAVLAVPYVDRRAWRKLRRVAAARSISFGPREWALAPLVLVAADLAMVGGFAIGSLDRLLRRRWRRRTRAYLEA
jgi:GT2 family glycosyltransferase